MRQLASESERYAFLASIRPGSRVGERSAMGFLHPVIVLQDLGICDISQLWLMSVFHGPDLVELVKDLDIATHVSRRDACVSDLEPIPGCEYPETPEQLERQLLWARDWLTRCDIAW
jgi:hypothetical protein